MRLFAMIIGLALLASSASAEAPGRFDIPSTVSPAAASELKFIYDLYAHAPPPARPTSLADWDKQYADTDRLITPFVKTIADKLGVTTQDDQIRGVPVLRVRPAHYQPSGRTLIYLHGGGYTAFSLRSSLGSAALVAAGTGDEVISVGYTVAPRGNWRTVTDQVLAVWKALLSQGVAPASIGIFGDSAGGGLAAGAVLKMRDQGLPLPGALYLMSPWSDITATGDTYGTLAAFDPSLDAESLSWSADAYADPKDQKNPYVSPVYGDYSKPFPPTLIQGGTREIFVSNFVRQYQVIRSGGHEAVLDLYEGMPHVFQALASDSPETKTAIARAAEFFKAHLKAN